ncbi:formate dehydrogenase subunit delta [Novosphingobium bradum]|uniref:Formate dehydrogenase subunit delta n=1 Tax=Novosphingobium bradum TaxID=1737444 RepID=A0ABV7IRW9_9SPHN
MDKARLHYMANQIARNLAAQGPDAAAEATARHLADYWDPRMKAALLGGGTEGLDPIARAAVDLLRAMRPVSP